MVANKNDMNKYDEYLEKLHNITEPDNIGLVKRSAEENAFVEEMVEDVYKEINELREERDNLEEEKEERIKEVKKDYEDRIAELTEKIREINRGIPLGIKIEKNKIENSKRHPHLTASLKISY